MTAVDRFTGTPGPWTAGRASARPRPRPMPTTSARDDEEYVGKHRAPGVARFGGMQRLLYVARHGR